MLLLFLTTPAFSQTHLSSDSLFILARNAAFQNHDYALAKQYLYQGIQQSPNYADLWVFMGRINSWEKHYDSASYYFENALKINPEYDDASLGYATMLYWNNAYLKALQICNSGLQYHPESGSLQLLKSKIFVALQSYDSAYAIIQQLIHQKKEMAAVRALAGNIKSVLSKNQIDLSYDFVYFDRQFNNPWHLASIDYGRTTSIGLVTGRLNYANRFNENALQFEIESYPHISKIFYSFINFGYTGNNNGVFPQWRGAFSLYANLPKSFEAEMGLRYLQFGNNPTWLYTAYAGKYYKNWLLGARAYIIPSNYTAKAGVSYSAMARYYLGGAYDFIGISAGYGISPDDRYNAILLDNPANLIAYKAGLLYRKTIGKMNVLSIDANWVNQEYLPNTKGNQYQAGVAWMFRF
ncbi:YaiO family outer membrane beta-barrel protein [Hydrotalea sp.]|nr:YaiO family outer membrane beta-barrel protein [Hydrotalea sp.]